MSELFIKWDSVGIGADRIKSDAKQLARCGNRVKKVADELQMSSELNFIIKRKLINEYDNISELSAKLDNMSSVLEDIAAQYKTTENSLSSR